MKETEIIANIDHFNHRLFIEKIDVDMLNKKYHGEEEEYINVEYQLNNDGAWSWDWVTDIECIEGDIHAPIDKEIAKWIDGEEEPIDLDIESWIGD